MLCHNLRFLYSCVQGRHARPDSGAPLPDSRTRGVEDEDAERTVRCGRICSGLVGRFGLAHVDVRASTIDRMLGLLVLACGRLCMEQEFLCV